MASLLSGYAWARDTVGESGGAVYRLHGHAEAPPLYLKHGRGRVASDVTDEMARLRWLAGQVPVPRVVAFAAIGDEAWLLTTALAGLTAYQALAAADAHARHAIVAALAKALVQWHAMPAERCPFNADHHLRLALANDRIEAGLIETEDFDEVRAGWSAAQLWAAITALLPLSLPAVVVTHGDFSLDNILLDGGKVTGCIDVGRAGLADSYQDVAIMWSCLGEFDGTLQAHFVTSYGIAALDQVRLEFHLMLDEFF